MNKLYRILIVAALCAIFAYTLWNPAPHHHAEEEEEHSHEFVEFSQENIKAHHIGISTASSGTIRQTVKAPARIVIGADSIAHVLPKVGGIALSANKNLGEHVKAGDLLATLDSKEMAEAKSNFLSATKKSILASKTFDRVKNLQEKNISSTQELNDAQGDSENSLIDLELAKQKLSSLGLNLEEINQLENAQTGNLHSYQIRSPIDGQIISRHLTIGELVTTDQEVYVVADLSKVWAEISIFSQDRPLIKQGQSLKITSSGNTPTDAKVIYLSPVIDKDTRTSTAIGEIDNREGNWLPGSFAQGILVTDEIQVQVIVPREAVQNIDGKEAVFVAKDNGFAVHQVSLGKADDEFYEIISGLAPGETYASTNTFLLKAELQKDEAEHMD